MSDYRTLFRINEIILDEERIRTYPVPEKKNVLDIEYAGLLSVDCNRFINTRALQANINNIDYEHLNTDRLNSRN